MKIPTIIRQFMVIGESLSLRQLVLNRFVGIIVILLLATAATQGYAQTNDDGHVSGRVVDENGDPVANATITIERVNIRNQLGKMRTTTDANGYYEFTGKTQLLEFRTQAVKDGVGSSVVERHHLYFRGQNTNINLVIRSGTGNDG